MISRASCSVHDGIYGQIVYWPQDEKQVEPHCWVMKVKAGNIEDSFEFGGGISHIDGRDMTEEAFLHGLNKLHAHGTGYPERKDE